MLASEIIRRVKEIRVRTGRHVADVLAGEYVSVFKGGGVEFEEVRPYVPGDDVRSIDWNVTARTGAPYVKRYIEERQLTLMLMADVSASQDFGSGLRSKREAAAELCALLAFSAIKNDDKVGLVLFHGEIEQYIPPRKGQKHALRVVREVLAHGESNAEQSASASRRRPHFRPELSGTARSRVGKKVESTSIGGANRSVVSGEAAHEDSRGRRSGASRPTRPRSRILERLAAYFPLGSGRRMRSARQATDIDHAMEFLLSVSKRKAVCFVVSDFIDTGFEQALRTANRKHDVIAVMISDPREFELPDIGLVSLEDSESGRSRVYDTSSPAFREALASSARDRVESLEKRLRSSGIDFIHIDASQSVVEPLVKFFRMRERRMRR